jgi:hypothetical protein
MSLQDDYFDLSASLKGWHKEAFDRVWEAFCDLESEQEDLLKIKGAVRDLLELTKDEVKILEQRLELTKPVESENPDLISESIQHDLICLLDSQFGEVEYVDEVKTMACQIVVDRFKGTKPPDTDK